MVTKDWILKNCLTKTGNLNNRVLIDSWWINRGFSRELDYLKSLQSDTTLTEVLFNLVNPDVNNECKVCGSKTNFINFKSGYRDYCSVKCVTQSQERNDKIKSKMDYASIHEKVKQTNRERYGVDHYFEISQEQIKETKRVRYGNETFNNPDKRRQTNIIRYGVEHSGQSKPVIEKIKRTREEKIPQLRDKVFLSELNKTHSQKEIAELFNVNPSAVSYWFKQHDISSVVHHPTIQSKPQQEIFEYCSSLTSGVVLDEKRIIPPKHIDVFIPDSNLAIELNGIYWHKEKKLQHLEKTNLLQDKGIRLIQFWDNEWAEKTDICKSIISNALGYSNRIYSRKCEVHFLDNKTYREFCESNHISGYAPASIRLGLFHNGDLVSVVGITKSRYDKSFEYELSRACSKLNFSVIGGLSKLLSHANITSIVSYCDRRIFTGVGYEKVGFDFLRNTPPNFFYWHIKDKKIISRIAAQKHKLPSLLENYDPNMSEHENMNLNGWFRVYDSGNSVWGKNINQGNI